MDAKQLGKRIKELRLAKKMTQSEVVGGFITRNMLSKIESGAAVPSLQTLQYLAGALGMPISAIMPDEGGVIGALNRCKQDLAAGRYGELIERLAEIEADFYDECQALGALANLALARLCMEQGALGEAAVHAETALAMSHNGVYASRDVHTQSLLLMESIAKSIEARARV